MSDFYSEMAFHTPAAAGRGERRSGADMARLEAICAEACGLACAIFGLPMAFIRLYEGEDLVSRAAHGMDDPYVLESAAFTVRRLVPGEGMTLVDASRDPRFFLEPAVLGAPGIRFYSDMPLVRDGVVIGVLALCEDRPRHDFGEGRQGLLRRYANQVALLVSLALASDVRGEAQDALKAQQLRMDMAADLSGLGFWIIDLKTRQVTWSKGLYDLFGIRPEEFTPQVATQLDLYNAADQSRLIEGFQRAIHSGEDFDIQVQILRRRDKALRNLRIKGGIETDTSGAPARLCAVARDVTAADVTVNAPMPEALPTQGLDVAAAKDEFLSHVANELKTPLKDIVSYARRLEGLGVAPDTAGYTSDLLDSAQSLQSLIGDTIDHVAPAEPIEPVVATDDTAYTIDDEVVDIAEILDESVAAFTDTARLRGNRLSLQFVDFVSRSGRLDIMRVQQVLANLIGNACKFTQGGTITVTASQVAAENPITYARESRLHISVRDTGTGMSEAKLQTAFSGLGLSVSRAIVDMLGGHIGLTSRAGQGSNAWFEIPVAWADGPVTVAKAAQPDPTAAPVPRTLQREYPAAPPAYPANSGGSNPGAYVPRPATARPAQLVDEDRINREYLKALLADMKLDLK